MFGLFTPVYYQDRGEDGPSTGDEEPFDASTSDSAGTSDAMLGTPLEEGEDAMPCIVSSWTLGDREEENSYLMFQD